MNNPLVQIEITDILRSVIYLAAGSRRCNPSVARTICHSCRNCNVEGCTALPEDRQSDERNCRDVCIAGRSAVRESFSGSENDTSQRCLLYNPHPPLVQPLTSRPPSLQQTHTIPLSCSKCNFLGYGCVLAISTTVKIRQAAAAEKVNLYVIQNTNLPKSQKI